MQNIDVKIVKFYTFDIRLVLVRQCVGTVGAGQLYTSPIIDHSDLTKVCWIIDLMEPL